MSEKWAIQKSTLDDIGNAIREKEGSTEGIPVKSLADRITALPVGSGENKLAKLVDGSITELTAEDLEGVTIIGSYAFYGCRDLFAVEIPDTVTEIGRDAFNCCFYDDKRVGSLTLGNSVKYIGNGAFTYCLGINSIILPRSLKRIDVNAFSSCRRLKDVFIEDLASYCEVGIATQYGSTVRSTNTAPIQYATKFYIKNALGEYEVPMSLEVPDEVQTIGKQVFDTAFNLTSVTIGNNVQTISHYAFASCANIVSVTIGNGVKSFGNDVFYMCKNLTNFTITSPISTSFAFKYSDKLTIDSLKNIINALVDYSGTENDSKYTLTLNSTCNATLEAEGATAPDGLTWKEYVSAKGWLLA